ncbi:unannotated protein [freshwater metagenome]|uniref:Unannotated protein n=1 Tax=freshwater metagenome TaxID=449393 RepID=A0A6J7US09_9ZZZZ
MARVALSGYRRQRRPYDKSCRRDQSLLLLAGREHSPQRFLRHATHQRLCNHYRRTCRRRATRSGRPLLLLVQGPNLIVQRECPGRRLALRNHRQVAAEPESTWHDLPWLHRRSYQQPRRPYGGAQQAPWTRCTFQVVFERLRGLRVPESRRHRSHWILGTSLASGQLSSILTLLISPIFRLWTTCGVTGETCKVSDDYHITCWGQHWTV